MNPHKSALGLGNYDINVILRALQNKGFDAIWFDKRKDPTNLNLGVITGFILNIPNPSYSGNSNGNKWSPTQLLSMPINYFISRKHWIAVRTLGENGLYFDLDSKHEEPQAIGEEKDLLDYLREKSTRSDCEIFVVIPSTVSQADIWCRT
jgi:josephin